MRVNLGKKNWFLDEWYLLDKKLEGVRRKIYIDFCWLLKNVLTVSDPDAIENHLVDFSDSGNLPYGLIHHEV